MDNKCLVEKLIHDASDTATEILHGAFTIDRGAVVRNNAIPGI